MLFQYKAIDQAGEKKTGEQSAPDRFVLAQELKSASGLTLVKATEKTAETKPSFMERLNLLLNRVKIKDQIVFASSLSAMLGAGLSLSRALSVIERQVANPSFKKIIGDLLEKVNRGSTLSQALQSHNRVFPPVFIAMVAAGEESGKLTESLEMIRGQLSKNYELRRKVKGAMIYPAVIVTAIIIIGILMMIFLVPNLTALFDDMKVDLPLSTRILVGVSNFLTAHTLIFVAVLLLVVVALVYSLRTKGGKRIAISLFMKTPVISTIIKNLNSAATMRTLSSLIASGVSLIESLTITSRVVQNPFYQAILIGAVKQVEKGATLSSIFKGREDLYPVLVGEMAEVGEETGNLTGMLSKGADFFEDEVEQATKNLSTLVEPALMILIGVAVGFFAVSMLGPMYSLSDKI
ncbi:MAG: type II secretion system F family protein [Patescibacteria group bacterium]|nr:type II secretion system F family protein [Patescibacteria group bacterium]